MVKLPNFITEFLKKFREAGYQIFIVGGAVRQLLQHEPVADWDFATNAQPDEIRQLFPQSFYDNRFGTIGVPLKQDKQTLILEVTTFRRESDYQDKRRPTRVEWTSCLEDDLGRRDFTINALAYDGEKIIDIFDGQNDLKNRIIRAVDDPNKRFNEDALRLIRAIRFAAQLGFAIEKNTRESIKQNAENIKFVSGERIREELFKIIQAKNAAEGILLLREVKLLKYILPELDDCFQIQQKSPARHHIYDVGNHLVMSLKHCPSKDVITRLATLLHDIGKAKTYRQDPQTKIITFYNHEVVSTNQVKTIAKRLRLSNKQTDKLLRLVRYHQFTVSEHQSDKAIRRFIREVGKDYLEDMIALRIADRLGSGAKATSWRFELFKKRLQEVQKEPFKVTDLKVDGRDVMRILQIKPGPQVGKVLNSLFNQVAEKKLINDRDILLKQIATFKRD